MLTCSQSCACACARVPVYVTADSQVTANAAPTTGQRWTILESESPGSNYSESQWTSADASPRSSKAFAGRCEAPRVSLALINPPSSWFPRTVYAQATLAGPPVSTRSLVATLARGLVGRGGSSASQPGDYDTS